MPIASDDTFADGAAPTKITYIDGRAATITIRRCRLEIVQGTKIRTQTFDQDMISIGATAENDVIIDDDTVANLQGFKDLGMRQVYPIGGAGCFVQIQHDAISCSDLDAIIDSARRTTQRSICGMS